MFGWLFRKKRRAQSTLNPAPHAQPAAVGNPYARPIARHPALDAPYGKRRDDDPGFDTTGFMLGYATGMPISPIHGMSAGSMLGAAMHPNPEHHSSEPAQAAPDPTPSSSCDTSSSSSSSYDSSSSSSSCDSGSSSGGGSE